LRRAGIDFKAASFFTLFTYNQKCIYKEIEMENSKFLTRSGLMLDRPHVLLESIVYHLFPGVLIAGFYLAVRPVVMARGFPSMAAMLLAIVCVALPVELGELVRRGYRRNGRLSLQGIVTYRRHMPAWRLAALTVGFLLAAALISVLTAGVDGAVSAFLRAWLPGWFFLNDPASYAGYSRSVLMGTLAANLVLNGLLAPLVEELYFRGFLLPRLERLGGWAPVVNALLFTLYHFWQPYAYFSIFAVLTPLAWLVWRKQSLSLGIAAHCAMNILGNLFLFAGILR
jgi:uncharacterized protein